jgi:hypothetical protein
MHLMSDYFLFVLEIIFIIYFIATLSNPSHQIFRLFTHELGPMFSRKNTIKPIVNNYVFKCKSMSISLIFIKSHAFYDSVLR